MIDLESNQHSLSSDYGLNIYFSRRFPNIYGPSFPSYKSLQNVDFSKIGNMQFFFQQLYSHIDKNSGEMFEDMFLVKIASKGTSLKVKGTSVSYSVWIPKSDFYFPAPIKYWPSGQFVWTKPPPWHNLLSNSPELPGGGGW